VAITTTDVDPLAVRLLLLRIGPRPDWHAAAACRGLPASLFYPPPIEVNDDDARLARDVCAACPVRIDCADYASDHEKDGIWGGVMRTRPPARRRRASTRGSDHEAAAGDESRGDPVTRARSEA
jgi:WhiB family redox-sensing transcriptional regulator